MRFSTAALMICLSFFHQYGVAATEGNSEPFVPVWRQQLTVAVEEFMQNWTAQAKLSEATQVSYEINGLDPRLKLSPCEQTPLISSSQKFRSGKLTLKTECKAPNPWKIYISVNVTRTHPVVFANVSLTRNSAISIHELELKPANIDQLNHGYFTNIKDAAGMITRRSIQQGKPLSPKQLTPPLLIAKGDSVLIEASNERITVKMPGLAMTNGRRGQQITVKNTQSKRMVRAEVISNRIVKVPL